MSTGLFHINLETGEPGPCKAKNGNCPFGGEELHYTSMEAARSAYETYAAVEKAKSLQAWKKKPARKPRAASTPKTSSNRAPLGGSGHGVLSHGGFSRATSYYGGGHGGHGR